MGSKSVYTPDLLLNKRLSAFRTKTLFVMSRDCLLSGSMLKTKYIKLLRAINTHYLDTCVTMEVHVIIIH